MNTINRYLRLLSFLGAIPILLTIIATILFPDLIFSNPDHNRTWSLFILYTFCMSLVLLLLTSKNFKLNVRIALWIVTPIILILMILNIFATHGNIEYEPHFDGKILFTGTKNEFLIEHDYKNWKHGKNKKDTAFIVDYGMLRKSNHVKKYIVNESWIEVIFKNGSVDSLKIK